jgi:arylsulfatase A-like enzyme/Flp pilus assembly protein TadD
MRLAFVVLLMTGLSGAATPPNIFLITIDTLRADHVHCYGYNQIQTPALDDLAKTGIRFTRAFTPSPLTNSSHTSILTGLLPSVHGVTDFGIPLDDSRATMAELLRAKGYHTAAFIGAIILDSKTLAPGLDRGFDFYDNFPSNVQSKTHWDRLERRGEVVVKHAEAWLTTHPAGPRFVWVHLYDPHDPYEPPAPYSETYKDRPYDGEIAYTDSALANFVAYLKAHAFYDNSLIVVVGDHGEGLGEHNEDTHGIFLYDSTTHVPLILKLPVGKNAGKVIDEQVGTLDILPTVLEYAGISKPEPLTGTSLLSIAEGPQKSSRPAVGETDYPLRFGWAPLRSVRTPENKFIEAPRPELYDLRSDAGEQNNLYDPHNELVANSRKLLASVLPPLANQPSGSLPDPKDKIQEQNLLHRALIATQDHRFADAHTALDQVLKLDPKSSLALRQLGEVELQTADYQQAAAHLKQAREVAPDDPAVGFLLGQALQRIKDFEGARAVLEQCLKTNPNEPAARLLLGSVYLDLKNPTAAADQFEAVLLVQPTDIEGQLGLAKAQIAQSKFTEAVSGLQDLAKSQANNADVFDLLAQAYRGLGKGPEAQRAEARAKLLRTK